MKASRERGLEVVTARAAYQMPSRRQREVSAPRNVFIAVISQRQPIERGIFGRRGAMRRRARLLRVGDPLGAILAHRRRCDAHRPINP